MRFARSKRVMSLKTIDSCFEELKESRLVEETFTVDEVREMLDGLQVVVRGEVEMELINTAHTNVLLLRQLFSQAEKFYLRLQSDISELENRELLEKVAHFEKTDFKNPKPKLAPLNEGGISELLQKEISSLEDTVAALREDYERSLCANAASQKDLQENLISLALAEKEFQQTAAYRNMEEILTRRTRHIKDRSENGAAVEYLLYYILV
uniref:Leucine zipper transcription factor-like protein 1 n=1 Tax=Gouania willdenowi TaxID=441366 RepID=A0A8C5I0I6_GOUWI